LLSEVRGRVSEILSRLPPEKREKEKENLEKKVLEDMIEEKLFLLEAEKKGLKVEEEEVEEELRRIKEKFPSEEEFFRTLKEEGKDLWELKQNIRENLLIRKVIQQEITSKLRVDEEEIRKFYEEYKEDLTPPPSVNISQILLKFEHSPEELKNLVKEIEERLRKGEDFYSLAREFSEGPYRDKGGRIGYLPETQLLPEIRIKLKSMKVGEVSSPIKCPDGIRFIKLEGIKKSPPPSWEDLREKIRRIILRRKTQEAINRWIEEKKKEYHVEVKW